ncbi:MAG: hypothetical protein QM790_16880 [Nibricoccus sp.]
MASSYRTINYSLRPAKAVERKMMGEAFRRIHPFQRVEDYRYVGFGSIYFSDFQLVHRALGITDMISIEKDKEAEECFAFNRPYRSIDLKFGHSGEVLPSLTWEKPTILWLDYDGKLDLRALSDVDTFCARCRTGSILIVSVNAQPEFEANEEERKIFAETTGEPFDAALYRYKKLQELVADKIPPAVKGSDLRGKGLATVSRKILINQISAQLVVRNAMLAPAEKLAFRQIFNFHYRDGALMLTVGGMIVRESDMPLFDACAFNKLPFTRTEEEPYEIRVPCLTVKEVRHLNSQLPKPAEAALSAPGVPQSDLETYAEVYRYFPSFGEIIFS